MSLLEFFDMPDEDSTIKVLEKERYFDEYLVEKMKYWKKNQYVLPFGHAVDHYPMAVKNNFQNKSKYFREMLLEVDAKKFMSDCSPQFMQVMESFSKCVTSESSGENAKAQILERFKFLDTLFKYYNSEWQRDVHVIVKEDSVTYDYHYDLFHISGIVSDLENGLLDERFISGFKCFLPQKGKIGACYFMIDKNYFYFTLFSKETLDNTIKINHSTFEGMCEILVLMNNTIGFQATRNYNFTVDELVESYHTINLPTSFPFRDEIFQVTHKYLREQIQSVNLGSPFSCYNQGVFRNVLLHVSYRLNVHGLHGLYVDKYLTKRTPKVESNMIKKQSKTKKNSYLSVKSIDFGRIQF